MAAKFRDYYEVLNVPRTASDEEIKKAYFRLAREHHPDLHAEKDKDLHTKRMQEVNEAYAVLSSKENRAKYDQFGQDWKEGPPPPDRQRDAEPSYEQTQEGFSDFFRHMFRKEQAQRENEEFFSSELDIEAVLDLSLKEAINGVERSFVLLTTGLCQNCHGTGRKNGVFCPVCGGVGEVRRQREVRTKIPAGLTEGGRIRLKGQGNEGAHSRGDLYLRIHLLPDPNFKVDGKNLETTLRIMPWAAALGAEIPVQTLEDSLRMRIPKRTHAGTRLRLAGKGLGKPGDRGDLFVRIEIDIPDVLTARSENLWKELEEESHA